MLVYDRSTMTEQEIAEGIIRDITVGVGDTGVCAGIIGEIGCSTPLDKADPKILRACAIAQQQRVSSNPSLRSA